MPSKNKVDIKKLEADKLSGIILLCIILSFIFIIKIHF